MDLLPEGEIVCVGGDVNMLDVLIWTAVVCAGEGKHDRVNHLLDGGQTEGVTDQTARRAQALLRGEEGPQVTTRVQQVTGTVL